MIIKCKNYFINTYFYGALQTLRYILQCLLHRKNTPSWNETEFALASSHMDYAFTIYMNTCCNWMLFEQVQEHTPNVIWWYKQRARTSLSSKPGSTCWAWVSNQVSYFKYVNMHINYTSWMLDTTNLCWPPSTFYIGLRDSPMWSTYLSTYLETLGQNPLVCITLVCGENSHRSVLDPAITITPVPSSLLITGWKCTILQYYTSVAVSINICFT